VSGVLQAAAKRNDCSAGGDYPAREVDGVVGVGVGAEVVFHRDVLKLAMPQPDGSGESQRASSETQMLLDLGDLC
jgi:hypothetical protein